jgi:hypothetical protein
VPSTDAASSGDATLVARTSAVSVTAEEQHVPQIQEVRNTEAAPPASRDVEGELRIDSVPSGARVTVNGVGWGETPLTVRYLPFGGKRVRLTKDGYVSVERRIELTADRPVRTISIQLAASGEPTATGR